MTKRDCLVTVHDQAQLPGILLQKCNLARAPAAGEDLGIPTPLGSSYVSPTGEKGQTALPHQDAVLSRVM